MIKAPQRRKCGTEAASVCEQIGQAFVGRISSGEVERQPDDDALVSGPIL